MRLLCLWLNTSWKSQNYKICRHLTLISLSSDDVNIISMTTNCWISPPIIKQNNTCSYMICALCIATHHILCISIKYEQTMHFTITFEFTFIIMSVFIYRNWPRYSLVVLSDTDGRSVLQYQLVYVTLNADQMFRVCENIKYLVYYCMNGKNRINICVLMQFCLKAIWRVRGVTSRKASVAEGSAWRVSVCQKKTNTHITCWSRREEMLWRNLGTGK